jgi:DNA (cytosine-5)-methyltransferase 1
MNMNAISLFSGMGGDSLGMKNAGINLVAYSEIIKEYQETHQLNFPDCKLIGNGDILKTSDEDFLQYKNNVNLIFAGFPCQGFSQAGNKKADDPRNTLFREFLRATKLINPDYIIGENVKGLLTRKDPNNRLFIDIIKEEFKTLGYNLHIKVMRASNYSIPQNRDRLIIVGIKDSIQKDFHFPEEESNENLNLFDIITFTMEGTIKIEKDDFDMDSIPTECIIKDLQNTENEMNPHPNLKLLSKDKDYEYKGKVFPRRIHFGKRIPVGGEIIDIRKPINTIISTYSRQPRFFVPQQNKNGYYLRVLTPTELKQLQGFPKDYKINGTINQQIIQIGNAVPPPLIEKVVNNLINV